MGFGGHQSIGMTWRLRHFSRWVSGNLRMIHAFSHQFQSDPLPVVPCQPPPSLPLLLVPLSLPVTGATVTSSAASDTL